jgi:hypothetical protein
MIDQAQTPTQSPDQITEIIARLERRLAAGMTRKRVALICDINESILDRLLSGGEDTFRRADATEKCPSAGSAIPVVER